MEAKLSRLVEAAGCRSQMELAAFLGIRQALVSDAKRRGIIPAEWLNILERSRGIRPEWILTGTPPKYVHSAE